MMRKKKLRLIERDGKQCFYCGMQAKRLAKLTVDHVVPRSQGGTSELGNLVLACRPCNVRKGGKTIAQWKQELEYMLASIEKISTKISLPAAKHAANSQSPKIRSSKQQAKKPGPPTDSDGRNQPTELPGKYRQKCLF